MFAVQHLNMLTMPADAEHVFPIPPQRSLFRLTIAFAPPVLKRAIAWMPVPVISFGVIGACPPLLRFLGVAGMREPPRLVVRACLEIGVRIDAAGLAKAGRGHGYSAALGK
jgi:hypothetical protein